LEFAKNFELDFEPGSQVNYSNSAFDILGIVIGRVSGMPFPDYVTEQVLSPAGMANSIYNKPIDSLPSNWAAPYSFGLQTQEWTSYPYADNYAPSSGLQTTLPDMCKWALLHLNKGSNGKDPVLDEQHYELLTSPHFDTPWDEKIGLSWFLQSYMDRPIIMHTGEDTGINYVHLPRR
jgi:CubicO group peptidase (beta-lactamase class C family)